MRISTCIWCGKGRRQVSPTQGIPGGVDMILESDRFKTMRLHSECAWNLRRKMRFEFREENESLLEAPFLLELMPPLVEILRRGK